MRSVPDQLPSLLADRDAYRERLELILPRAFTGTNHSDNPVAAAAAFTMLYVGAVDGHNPIRPSSITWMSDAIADHRTDEQRLAYYEAAMVSLQRVEMLCQEWGVEHRSWYASNSREGPRDDTFRAWRDNGALLIDPTVPTTSARPRYTLAADFATLFSPDLTGDSLTERVRRWQDEHLSAAGMVRAQRARQERAAEAAVTVKMPGGKLRALHPGASSEIARAVIEQLAPSLLGDPVVILVSESGDKLDVLDDQLLRRLGLPIDVGRLLPDLLLIDVATGADHLWMIEIVATDGAVTEARKADLTEWATQRGRVAEDKCRFLTAFASRTAAPAKRLLPVLARGSFAWFADEPDGLLSWDDIAASRE